LAHQRPTVVGAHRHQLRLAIGKVQHLQSTRLLNQTIDIIGYQLLGANQHVNRDGTVIKQAAVGEVGGSPDSGNFGGSTKKAVGYLTGDHIDLVIVGHRHQHIGVFDTRLLQHIRVGACAVDHTYVEAIAQLAQANLVHIHHGNVISFTGEVFRQAGTHLTSAENNDFHKSCLGS